MPLPLSMYGPLPVKLIVRTAYEPSTLIVRPVEATGPKLTNAAESFGRNPVDHFASSDQFPLLSTFHEIPTGGVTCAHVLSIRSASTCTEGTVALACRRRKLPMPATPPCGERSLPVTGAVRIGDAPVETVGAAAAPKFADDGLI